MLPPVAGRSLAGAGLRACSGLMAAGAYFCTQAGHLRMLLQVVVLQALEWTADGAFNEAPAQRYHPAAADI